MRKGMVGSLVFIVVLLIISFSVRAVEWSDNSIGVRHGDNFSETGSGRGITKTTYNFTHASGGDYGNNYFSTDVIISDSQDSAVNGRDGAQEYYGIYQRTIPFSAFGVGSKTYDYLSKTSLLFRVDLGSKNTDFGSRPRKFRIGLEFPVQIERGFWNFSLSAYKESNYNGFVGKSVSFDPTWSLGSVWSLPVGPGSFGGFVSVIGEKGKDGFGHETKTETLVRIHYLLDVGSSGLKVGLGYQSWRNMFGNDESLDSSGGSRENTPMLMAEYHF